MLGSQVTDIAHTNPFFQQWGLAGVLAVFSVALIPVCLWLFKRRKKEFDSAVSRIKSSLSSVFQRTVVNEAMELLARVDEHLPYALSQTIPPDEHLPSALSQTSTSDPVTSRFDYLCGALSDMPADQLHENRPAYGALLKRAFAELIIDQAKKLVMVAAANAPVRENPTGLRYSFEQETEAALAIIARKTAQATRRARMCWATRVWAVPLAVIAWVFNVLLIFPMLVDTTRATIWGVVCLSLVILALVSCYVSLVIHHLCDSWLQNASNELMTTASNQDVPIEEDL